MDFNLSAELEITTFVRRYFKIIPFRVECPGEIILRLCPAALSLSLFFV